MFTNEELQTQILCPDCKKPMYALKGADHPIFICSYCGASYDKQTLDKKMKQNQNEPNGKDHNLLRNLFSPQFMRKYTNFKSFSEFIKQCDLFNDSIENISKDAIATLPDRKINRYVKKHTRFSTWNQMFEKAVEWYLKM